MHPFASRAISLREAARIQSFPDFYSFAGAGVVDAYSLVGDAVPPLLSNQLAARLEEVDARDEISAVRTGARRGAGERPIGYGTRMIAWLVARV